MKFLSSLPIRALALGTLLLATVECSVSEQVKDSPSKKSSSLTGTDEQREAQAYAQMQFRLNFMDEAQLGGQDVLFVRQASDLTSPQQTKLQTALQTGNLPLHLKMRIFARNSSPDRVQLKQLDYQVLLDGRELTSGSTGVGTEVESSAIVTLPVAVDLKVPRDRTAGSTPAAFAAGLADFTGSSRRLTMRIRPAYVNAAGHVTQSGAFEPIALITKKR